MTSARPNVSAYSFGVMGYRTPHIDRLAKEGMMFTDYSDGAGVFIAAPAVAAQFLDTFKEYPPSQRPSSFSIDQIVEKMRRSFETTPGGQ